MDPGWLILFTFLCLESVVVLLLVLPVPSNAIRQAVISAPVSVWTKYSNVRFICYAILALDVFYFVRTYRLLHYSAQGPYLQRTCEGKIEFFREQRNLYITGFGAFLFFVMTRLLAIQTQLYTARVALKGKAMAKKKD